MEEKEKRPAYLLSLKKMMRLSVLCSLADCATHLSINGKIREMKLLCSHEELRTPEFDIDKPFISAGDRIFTGKELVEGIQNNDENELIINGETFLFLASLSYVEAASFMQKTVMETLSGKLDEFIGKAENKQEQQEESDEPDEVELCTENCSACNAKKQTLPC